MNVKDFKNTLSELNELTFVLPNGSHIAPHFHLTEVGEITKSYVDCRGSVRLEKTANFQLWTAHDYDHRLKPRKVIEIIEMAEKEIGLQNLDIEVEYQSETIGRYGLEFKEDRFILTAAHRLPFQRKMRYSRSKTCKPHPDGKSEQLLSRGRVLLKFLFLVPGRGLEPRTN